MTIVVVLLEDVVHGEVEVVGVVGVVGVGSSLDTCDQVVGLAEK